MQNLVKDVGIPMFDIEGHLRSNATPPVRFVRLPTRRDRQQTWFLADKRAVHDGKGHMLERPWVCVHGGTKSLNTILRELQWISDPYRTKNQPWIGYWVIEADNASHAAAFLKSRGERVKHQINGKTGWDINPLHEEFINMKQHPTDEIDMCCGQCGAYPCQRERGCIDPTFADNPDIRALQRTIERAQAKIDFIASLPSEPAVDEDGVAVIFFKKTFSPGGQVYDYSAIKSRNGRWNTTGPRSPKDYSWDQLVRWIFDGSPNTEILVATEWVAL